MDDIIDVLVSAGYFRARINTLADFDKMIGGFAWAMQAFSSEFDIDIFYTDSLDLGQKIALTERLVMVLVALKCPHRIEPHQIVGLDYSSLLPVVKWLIKRSAEVRQEHEAFNRLLALRHYFRVINPIEDFSKYRYVVPTSKLKGLHRLIGRKSGPLTDEQIEDRFNLNQQDDESLANDTKLLARKLLNTELDHNQLVSFTNLPFILDSSGQINASQLSDESKVLDHTPDGGDSSDDDSQITQVERTEGEHESVEQNLLDKTVMDDPIDHGSSEELTALDRELDTELLATNQKILNLIKKLDQMPSSMEIMQYQRRYIELHQQLISKNKDVKKLYALYNSLDSTKYYLGKEINLLDSIADNLELTVDSPSNRDDFIIQLQEIITRIETVRDEVLAKLEVVKKKCEDLNIECSSIIEVDRCS